MRDHRVEDLLERYVAAVNRGVREGNWADMLALLREDAEMEFVGIPVGPFHGREAIETAYRNQPPDDELILLDRLHEQRGALVATYAWAQEPARPAGELHLWEADGEVTSVRVLYEQFSDLPSS
jgi:steroid Delta-isomerase